jgi:hypothetical protein
MLIWRIFVVFVAKRGGRPEAAWFALAATLLISAVAVTRPARGQRDERRG